MFNEFSIIQFSNNNFEISKSLKIENWELKIILNY